jgi:hypothetical protein
MYIPPVETHVLTVKMTKLNEAQRMGLLQVVLNTLNELGVHVTAIELESITDKAYRILE